jgi:hypothetical protein
MIALGIFTLIALFAVFEAWQDFEIINNHEEVEHINAWMLRAFVTCYLWGAASIWIGWDAAIYAVASAFLFSAVFRCSLNRMRGKDWRYLSPSSWYDYGYLMLTGAWQWKQQRWTWSNWQSFMRHAHRNNYLLNPPYVEQIHRAGLYAYITELTIATACVMWVVLT